VEAHGLSDGKKIRSRFIEELIWTEEQRSGRILVPDASGSGTLTRIACALPPVSPTRAVIPATPAITRRMALLLGKQISPSLLDAYLRCPARFFYERIGRISPPANIMEGSDPQGVGLFLHTVLRAYCAERLYTPITANPGDLRAAESLFRRELAGDDLRRTLPPDDRLMLEEAGPLLLANLLRAQEGCIPLAVEEAVTSPLMVDGTLRLFGGTIDRVDERDGGVLVLDYKTGRIPKIRGGIWNDGELWREIAAWRPGDGDAALHALAAACESVQLPAYLYMHGRERSPGAANAAYVPLRDPDRESPLFDDAMDKTERRRATEERIPLMLAFLVRHMAHAATFPPRESDNCLWCPCNNMCILMPPRQE
jgi:hypothetical protein